MKKIQNFIVSSILMLNLFSMPLLAQTTQDKATPVASKNQDSFLFVQTAKKATLESISGAIAAERITIENTAPSISFVNNHANESTGSISLNKFLHQWDGPNSLKSISQNVYVSGTDNSANHKKVSFMAQLVSPHYDAKRNTLTYDLKVTSSQSGVNNKLLVLTDVTISFDNAVCPSCICC